MTDKLFVHVRLPYFSNAYNDATSYEVTFRDMLETLKEIKKQRISSRIVFLLNHMWEMTDNKELSFLHNFFYKKLERYNVDWFLFYSQTKDTDLSKKNIVKYNFFQNKTVYNTTANNQDTSETWNRLRFKGLFLTGKAHKPQRLIPLKQLLKHGLLNTQDMEWSFFYHRRFKADIKAILNLDDAQLENFISATARNPDDIDVWKFGNLFSHDGFPYDANLYRNTSWSLISETSIDKKPFWITEKTYRAIINKHPFIFFGQPKTEEHLRSLGFKTFDYCFPHKYDMIDDDYSRFFAAVENVVFLKKHWHDLDFERINSDIEHNYNHLFKNCLTEQEQLIKKLKVKDNSTICDFFSFKKEGIVSLNTDDILNGKRHLIYYNWEIE